ncbi:MAG: hypothetical protein ACFFDF_02740 [Candidatus Odinarchaeota archaeon]
MIWNISRALISARVRDGYYSFPESTNFQLDHNEVPKMSNI